MNILKLFFLLIIPLILVFSCKEKDEIEPVEVPFHSRVEIDFTGALINDGDWIEIDGVRYTHKLDSFNVISVLDSGYLLTTISADSIIDTTQVIDSIKTTITTDTSYVIDIITGDTIEVINTTIKIDTNLIPSIDTSINVDLNNYHAPGGSLLLMLLKDIAFIQSIDTANGPTITIVQSVTADSVNAQISEIKPGDNISMWDTFDLKIGATTIFYVTTEPKISNVTAGLYQAIKNEISANPSGDWATALESVTDKYWLYYVELKGKIDTAFIVTSSTSSGAANYSSSKYILKVFGGEAINQDNMFDIRNITDIRAKTIQIESKTGSEIIINTSTGYGAEITYY